MRRHRRKGIRLKPFTKIVVLLAIVVIFFVICETGVRKLPREYIQINAQSFAYNAISEVIEKNFSDIEDTYNLFINENGNLTYIESNADVLAKLKSDLNKKVNESLNDNNFTYIPFGSLTGISLLDGFGVKIPVNIYYTGSSAIEIESDVTSSGINQSLYIVKAKISATVASTSISNSYMQTFEYDYVLCEVIFTGEVPNIDNRIW